MSSAEIKKLLENIKPVVQKMKKQTGSEVLLYIPSYVVRQIMDELGFPSDMPPNTKRTLYDACIYDGYEDCVVVSCSSAVAKDIKPVKIKYK